MLSVRRIPVIKNRRRVAVATRLPEKPSKVLTLGSADLAAFPVTFAEGTQLPGNQRSFPIPAADGASIDRTEEVIVARVRQQIFAFNLACPHEHTALRWRAERRSFRRSPRRLRRTRPA